VSSRQGGEDCSPFVSFREAIEKGLSLTILRPRSRERKDNKPMELRNADGGCTSNQSEQRNPTPEESANSFPTSTLLSVISPKLNLSQLPNYQEDFRQSLEWYPQLGAMRLRTKKILPWTRKTKSQVMYFGLWNDHVPVKEYTGDHTFDQDLPHQQLLVLRATRDSSRPLPLVWRNIPAPRFTPGNEPWLWHNQPLSPWSGP
jgi:hypothetical protein